MSIEVKFTIFPGVRPCEIHGWHTVTHRKKKQQPVENNQTQQRKSSTCSCTRDERVTCVEQSVWELKII